MAIRQFQGEYRWLSNFWPVQVVYDMSAYPSVEHAYQAAKTLIAEERSRLFNVSAGQAKRIARTFTIRPDWVFIKRKVMLNLVRQKFGHPQLAEKLSATGKTPLYEGNTWGDLYWGIDLKTGEGTNHLGKILMKVRQEINGED